MRSTIGGALVLALLSSGLAHAQHGKFAKGPADGGMSRFAVIGTDEHPHGVVTFREELPPGVRDALRIEPREPFFGNEGTPDGRPTHYYDLHGVNLGASLGPGPHSAATIGEFTDRLLIANADLVGLAPGAGVLVRRRVKVDDTNLAVIYEQCATDSHLPVIGSMVKVNVDADGDASSLLRVTWLGIDGLPTGRIGPLDAERALPALMKRVEWFGATRDFTLERTKVLREGLLPIDAATLRPAWEIEVEGWVSGGGERTSKAPLVAYVDAVEGSLLKVVPALAHAASPTDTFTEQGIVEHYDPNPLGPTVTLLVFQLDNTYFELRSKDAWVTETALLPIFVAPGYVFAPSGFPYPYSYYMADTSAFMGITSCKRSFASLGHSTVVNFQITVEPMDWDYNGSNYQPATKSIHMLFSGLGPEAYERQMVIHEFGHAANCDVGGSAPYGCALANNGSGNTSTSLDEGTCMYHQTALNNTTAYNPWIAFQYSPTLPPFDVGVSKTLENYGLDQYQNGLIWTSALWNLRKSLGSDADRLAIQFLYHVTPTIDFHGALEAVVQADRDLYGGVHEPTIRRVFSFAKVYGAQAPPTWSTPFLKTDTRPYPNTYSATKAHTIAGASELRVTFDAFTKVNENDALVITDGAGVPIEGSPFLKESLRGQTISVPGDTVRITLDSLPTDNLGGAGYLVKNIAALDPANASPVPVIEVSPVFGFDPLVVEFDLEDSFDPDGEVIQVNLDPGDGSPLIALDWPAVKELRHIYRRNGPGPIVVTTEFTATFFATDDSGASTTATRVIRVSPYEPDPAWTALSGAKPGSAGLPLLSGSGPLSSGSSNTLHLSHGKPSAPAALVAGLGAANLPYKGGVLVPDPLIVVTLTLGPDGQLTLPFTWPTGVPAGTQVHMQVWIQDSGASYGFAASNALRGTAK